MAFLVGGPRLCALHLAMHRNLLAAFFHRELQLKLAVLQREHFVRLLAKCVAQAPHLQLHHVAGHHGLFLALRVLVQLSGRALVFELQFCTNLIQLHFFLFARIARALLNPQLIA